MEKILSGDTVLENRYKVIQLIHVGPISRTYEGYDLKYNKRVFIKELFNKYKDPALRQQAIEQFKSEANIIFKLRHKNLPTFQDYFDYEENRYIIIEYIVGKRLITIVENHKGFLPEKKVIEYGIELCELLSYLHNIKPGPVIFRDMSPDSIILSDEGILKLIDFGISKIYEEDKKTRDVAKVIIQNYSPIEQHTGGTDTRSDIYSLGATMYYLITKEPPMDCIERSFSDTPIKTCRKINPAVSLELDRIILKSMKMDKKNRYQDIDEMKSELIKLSQILPEGNEIECSIEDKSPVMLTNPELCDCSIQGKALEHLDFTDGESDIKKEKAHRKASTRKYKEEDIEISQEIEKELPVLNDTVILKGQYRIIKIIKKNIFTRVYKGEDLKRNQMVIIKELLPEKLNPLVNKEIINRIDSETRALLYLDHMNLPDFQDYFSMECKNYLVMEYIEGESLKSIVENGNSLPSWNNVLEWSIQICNVLNYLHSRKPAPFVFRFLCPENILLEETGMVKLIDFGTGKLYNHDLKSSGEGMSCFSSPEESIGEIDKRSDIYSLGATIYYLLTGNIPAGAFNRKDVPLNMEEFDKDIPQELIEIIWKSTEIDKNKRFQDILIMKEYLEVLWL